MEYDKNMIGSFVSPGSKEGETGITHFLIRAKQTIRFSKEESERLRDDIFESMIDINCLIFSNFRGIEVFEDKIIEATNFSDPKIEKIRRELSEQVVQTTTKAYKKLNYILEQN